MRSGTRRQLLIGALAMSGIAAASTLVAQPWSRSGQVASPRSDSVLLEELTWIEVRDAVAAGKTTVVVPTGGTEQNGPHMVLGKHNYLVGYKAGEIAGRLGNALVAPVIA
jgi:hypothetical protein